MVWEQESRYLFVCLFFFNRNTEIMVLVSGWLWLCARLISRNAGLFGLQWSGKCSPGSPIKGESKLNWPYSKRSTLWQDEPSAFPLRFVNPKRLLPSMSLTFMFVVSGHTYKCRQRNLDFPQPELASAMLSTLHRFWPRESIWRRAPKTWRWTHCCHGQVM